MRMVVVEGRRSRRRKVVVGAEGVAAESSPLVPGYRLKVVSESSHINVRFRDSS